MLLLARVDDDVQRQLLLPFEGLHADLRGMREETNPLLTTLIKHSSPLAYIADVWAIGNVGQLVPSQVVLALQRSIADVADKSPFHRMRDDVLLDQRTVRIGHLALGTAEQGGSVERLRLPDLAGLRSWLLLAHGPHLGRLLGLFLLLLARGRRRGHLTRQRAVDPVATVHQRGRRTARGAVGCRHARLLLDRLRVLEEVLKSIRERERESSQMSGWRED